MRPYALSLIGLGTVGGGVAQILTEQADAIAARAGRPVVLRHVVVRDADRPRDVALPAGLVHTDIGRAIADPQVDAVVEVMGGLTPALSHVRAALEAGKDVVTANKALLCVHGDELFAAAGRLGRAIGFEAAVAGGVPVVAGIGQALAGNRITGIEAILNGTSNFILSQMAASGRAFADVLAEAQALGYAEADPTLDLDGTDAAQKLALLARIAFGVRVQPEQFLRQGIDRLDAADLAYARELGCAVKLLAVAKRHPGSPDGRGDGPRLEMHVGPTLVKADRPLAQVDGARNMVAAEGDAVGTVWWAGPGAGRMATASAVVADIIDLAIGRAQLTFPRLNLAGSPDGPANGGPADGELLTLLPADAIRRRAYLRFLVEDRPHVVADIADILGRHGISLASIIQHEAPETDAEPQAGAAPLVPLVVMTHRTTEGQLRAAETELARLPALRTPWLRLPVAD